MVCSELKHTPATGHTSFKDNPLLLAQGSSFRNCQPSTETSKTGRCIFCGNRTKDHLSQNCFASCNTSGVPCHLFRVEPSGIRQSKSGKRYCYSWNGVSGCDKGTTCCRGEYLCTLCGATVHNAQQCDAVALGNATGNPGVFRGNPQPHP